MKSSVDDLRTVADVMAGFMSERGVQYAFGYPGDPNIPLLEAASRSDIEFVAAAREGTAAFMAQAASTIADQPGIAISTLGPGSTALVNGVASAFLDRVPMLAISGQVGASLEPYFTHQVIDHRRLFAPITKWVATISQQNAATVMRRAWRIAMSERPGPVHITTPADVIGDIAVDSDVAASAADRPDRDAGWSYSASAEGELSALIRQAKRPVVVAGIGAARADAGSAVQRFAEAASCPVVVTAMAKGVVPAAHPLFAGVLDMACNELVWNLLDSADLIVACGFDGVDLIKPWALKSPVISVDVQPNTDLTYNSIHDVVGPIAAAIDGLPRPSASKWSKTEIQRYRNKLDRALRMGRAAGRLNPTDVVDALIEKSSEEAIVTTDVGSHKLLVAQAWPTMSTRQFLTTNGLSAMGYSLPAAIAAKLVRPAAEVVCTVGDGGFAMADSELRLAAERKLAITVVVFNDASLNRIELKQKLRGLPSVGTRVPAADIPRWAEALGSEGVQVRTRRELDQALARSPTDRPLVIDAIVSPDQYEAQF